MVRTDEAVERVLASLRKSLVNHRRLKQRIEGCQLSELDVPVSSSTIRRETCREHSSDRRKMWTPAE